MILLIEIAIVLIGVGALVAHWQSKGRERERDALVRRRVDAYIETIRRDPPNPDLDAMSDMELRDLLHAGSRNLRTARGRRGYVLAGGGIVTVVATAFAGSERGWLAAALVLAIGAIAVYGLHVYLVRRARAPLERYGIDIERIRVE